MDEYNKVKKRINNNITLFKVLIFISMIFIPLGIGFIFINPPITILLAIFIWVLGGLFILAGIVGKNMY